MSTSIISGPRYRVRLGALAVASSLLTAPLTSSAQRAERVSPNAGPIRDILTAVRVAQEGAVLSAAEAREMEAHVREMPDDLVARVRLLAFYTRVGTRAVGVDSTIAGRRRQVLWLVEHDPASEVFGLNDVVIEPIGSDLADADGYQMIRLQWLHQVAQHSDDANVLLHATSFLALHDKRTVVQLLERSTALFAREINLRASLGRTYAFAALGIIANARAGQGTMVDRNEARSRFADSCIAAMRSSTDRVVVRSAAWNLALMFRTVRNASNGRIDRESLAEEMLRQAIAGDSTETTSLNYLIDIYGLRMTSPDLKDAARRRLAQQRMEFAQLLLVRSSGSPSQFLDALVRAARAAVYAEAYDSARVMAEDILRRVPDTTATQFGPAFHEAHITLGLIALHDRRLDDARAELLRAANVRGGGSLGSIGPSMALAEAFVARGERDVVIKFLDRCGAFWSNPLRLRWIEQLRAGVTPNFRRTMVF